VSSYQYTEVGSIGSTTVDLSVVPGLEVDDFARSKMELSANELDEERSMAYEFVSSERDQ